MEDVILKFCVFLNRGKKTSNLYKPALHLQQYFLLYTSYFTEKTSFI